MIISHVIATYCLNLSPKASLLSTPTTKQRTKGFFFNNKILKHNEEKGV